MSNDVVMLRIERDLDLEDSRLGDLARRYQIDVNLCSPRIDRLP